MEPSTVAGATIQVFARVRPPRAAPVTEAVLAPNKAQNVPATPSRRQGTAKKRELLASPTAATMTPAVSNKTLVGELVVGEHINERGLPDHILFRDTSAGEEEIGASGAFELDGVLDTAASQSKVWKVMGVDHVTAVLQGFNSTIFAYGRTASGKTYTIIGPTSARGDGWSFSELDAELNSLDDAGCASAPSALGLVPRAFHSLLQAMHAQRGERHFTMKFACAEIYNRSLFDLCAGTRIGPDGDADDVAATPTHMERVEVRDSRMTTAAAEKLTWHSIDLRAGHEDDAMAAAQSLIHRANAARAQAATAANADSSRSHVLYMCRITSVGAEGAFRDATLSIVDLAGSESLDLKEKGTLVRDAETKAINSSLHTLTRVVQAFAAAPPGTRPAHVPYRESLLTLLLKDAIGGNCKTSIVVTLGTEDEQLLHSYKSCQFARLARGVKNCARENKTFDPGHLITSLRSHISEMTEMLAAKDAALAEVDRDLRLSQLLDLASGPEYDAQAMIDVLDAWLERVHASAQDSPMAALYRMDAVHTIRQLAALSKAAAELVKATGASTVLDPPATHEVACGPSPVKKVDAATHDSPAHRRRAEAPPLTDAEAARLALAEVIQLAKRHMAVLGDGADTRVRARLRVIEALLSDPVAAAAAPPVGAPSVPAPVTWFALPMGALCDWQELDDTTNVWRTADEALRDAIETAAAGSAVASAVVVDATGIVVVPRADAYAQLLQRCGVSLGGLTSITSCVTADRTLADDVQPAFSAYILDPSAALKVCLRTGCARRVRRVVHVAQEGYLHKRRAVRGGYVSRAYRLTPAGMQQLMDAPACRAAVSAAISGLSEPFRIRHAASLAGVSKTKVAFSTDAAVHAEVTPTAEAVHGCHFVVRGAKDYHFVAASIQDAAAWVSAINGLQSEARVSADSSANAAAVQAWLQTVMSQHAAVLESQLLQTALQMVARDHRELLAARSARLSLLHPRARMSLLDCEDNACSDVNAVLPAIGVPVLRAMSTSEAAVADILQQLACSDAVAALAAAQRKTSFMLRCTGAWSVDNDLSAQLQEAAGEVFVLPRAARELGELLSFGRQLSESVASAVHRSLERVTAQWWEGVQSTMFAASASPTVVVVVMRPMRRARSCGAAPATLVADAATVPHVRVSLQQPAASDAAMRWYLPTIVAAFEL